jgi:hypothetical protein
MRYLILLVSFVSLQYLHVDAGADTTEVRNPSNVSVRALNTSSDHKEKSLKDLAVSPIVYDTNGFGALHVIVSPEDVSVYINGELAGTGDQHLKKIKPGFYTIHIVYKGAVLNEYVLIRDGDFVNKVYNFASKPHVSIEPQFSSIIANRQLSYGPSIDVGLVSNNSYFGVSYSWNFGTYSIAKRQYVDVMVLGGAALQYRYTFLINEKLTLSPGANFGFWYSSGEIVKWPPDGGEIETDDDYFLGGLTLTTRIGKGKICGTVTTSLLIGTTIAAGLQFGLHAEL